MQRNLRCTALSTLAQGNKFGRRTTSQESEVYPAGFDGGDEPVLAAAFVWRRYDIAGRSTPLFACVLVTVAANPLLTSLPTDRMPAFLAPEDWQTWLGEKPASLEAVKACLRTVEGARWTMTKEARPPRRKPTLSDPAGLF